MNLYSTAALVLNGTAPFSDRTYLVADCNYLIGFNDVVVALQSGKHLFCVPFFDCLRAKSPQGAELEFLKLHGRKLRDAWGRSARSKLPAVPERVTGWAPTGPDLLSDLAQPEYYAD